MQVVALEVLWTWRRRIDLRAWLVPTLLLGLLSAAPLAAQQVPEQYYFIVAKHSGLVLDVTASDRSNGAAIIQWHHHGGENQQFRLQPEGGSYFKIINRNSGKALDVTGGVGATGNGVRLQQYTASGGDNQRFRLSDVGGGYYRIVAKHSGKALDVTGGVGATQAGVPIQQYSAVGGDNQKFQLVPVRQEGDGIDLRGGDYRSFVVSDRDPVSCSRQCERESSCRCWTYNKVSGHCYLKSSVPGAVAHSDSVSGLKLGAVVLRDDDAPDDLAEVTRSMATDWTVRNYVTSGNFERDFRAGNTEALVANIGARVVGRVLQHVATGNFRTLTIGISQSVGVGIGASAELGIAMPLDGRGRSYLYTTQGISAGLIQGASLGLSLSLHVADPTRICGESKVYSASLSPPGLPVSIGVGIAYAPLDEVPFGHFLTNFDALQSISVSVAIGITLVEIVSFETLPSPEFEAGSTVTVVGGLEGSSACGCGEVGQRPCTLLERFPSCVEGAYEDFARHRCLARSDDDEDDDCLPGGGWVSDGCGILPRDPEPPPSTRGKIGITFDNRSAFLGWFEIRYTLDGRDDREVTGEFESDSETIYIPADAYVTTVKAGYRVLFDWKYITLDADRPAASLPTRFDLRGFGTVTFRQADD